MRTNAGVPSAKSSWNSSAISFVRVAARAVTQTRASADNAVNNTMRERQIRNMSGRLAADRGRTRKKLAHLTARPGRQVVDSQNRRADHQDQRRRPVVLEQTHGGFYLEADTAGTD